MSRTSRSSNSQSNSVGSKDALNSYFDVNFSMDINKKMRVPEQITLVVPNQSGTSAKKELKKVSSLMEVPEHIIICEGNEVEEGTIDHATLPEVDDTKYGENEQT